MRAIGRAGRGVSATAFSPSSRPSFRPLLSLRSSFFSYVVGDGPVAARLGGGVNAGAEESQAGQDGQGGAEGAHGCGLGGREAARGRGVGLGVGPLAPLSRDHWPPSLSLGPHSSFARSARRPASCSPRYPPLCHGLRTHGPLPGPVPDGGEFSFRRGGVEAIERPPPLPKLSGRRRGRAARGRAPPRPPPPLPPLVPRGVGSSAARPGGRTVSSPPALPLPRARCVCPSGRVWQRRRRLRELLSSAALGAPTPWPAPTRTLPGRQGMQAVAECAWTCVNLSRHAGGRPGASLLFESRRPPLALFFLPRILTHGSPLPLHHSAAPPPPPAPPPAGDPSTSSPPVSQA
jgi:hypothetical protein